MSYYPTIEEDLVRAKAILAEGKAEEAELATFDALSPPEIKANWSRAAGGAAIFGKNIYAAYKLLESFVAEIERLRLPTAMLLDGENPAIGYCRICGRLNTPPYAGYYRDAICSRECFAEWDWRRTLVTVQKGYYQQPRQESR